MKLLRTFAWSWALSAIAIFSVASVFTRTFDPNRGHAFIASILGVMPAGLLTLTGFMIKALDESIEARVASALIWGCANAQPRRPAQHLSSSLKPPPDQGEGKVGSSASASLRSQSYGAVLRRPIEKLAPSLNPRGWGADCRWVAEMSLKARLRELLSK